MKATERIKQLFDARIARVEQLGLLDDRAFTESVLVRAMGEYLDEREAESNKSEARVWLAAALASPAVPARQINKYLTAAGLSVRVHDGDEIAEAQRAIIVEAQQLGLLSAQVVL